MKQYRFAIIVLASALTTASFAGDLGLAKTFNAFVFGNANTPGGHADGAVAIGGNWNTEYNVTLGPNYGVLGSLNKIGAYVGGNVTVTNHPSVNSGANLYVHGSYPGGYNLNGGGTLTQGAGVDTSYFATQKTYSLAQSSLLFSKGGNAINVSDPNNLHLDASTYAGSTKYFTIAGSDLAANRTLDISNLGSNTLVINVTGNVSDFGLTVNNNGDYSKILWNFQQATTVNIGSRALHGSILAPSAALTQSQNIDGTLIANTWNVNGSVEIHAGNKISFNGEIPGPNPVPEPATMVALGGLTLGLLRRRSSKKA